MGYVDPGSHIAKIDEKGRLKLPAAYRECFEQNGDSRKVFVTSIKANGESVRIYPLTVWTEIAAKLAQLPTSHKTRAKFLSLVMMNGQTTEIDAQSRVLIHPRLRESAAMQGEVTVSWHLQYLEVWNQQRIRERAEDLTDEDLDELSRHGI